MSDFSVHTIQSASAQSSELLIEADAAYGFVPNLLGVLAESPTALKAYMTLSKFFEQSSLLATERQVADTPLDAAFADAKWQPVT